MSGLIVGVAVVDGHLAADGITHGDRASVETEAPGAVVLIDPARSRSVSNQRS